LKLLLDTHALIWWLGGDEALSIRARAAIGNEDNSVLVSAATAWEIATKYRLGKLPSVTHFIADIEGRIVFAGFEAMPVTLRHGQTAGALPGHHNDPFDRMLIAQAMMENCTLVSADKAFDAYGVAWRGAAVVRQLRRLSLPTGSPSCARSTSGHRPKPR
jgi:PIN domain nuclease of toxin-antitoxin system